MLLLLLLLGAIAATASAPPTSSSCEVTAFGAKPDDDAVDDSGAFHAALAAGLAILWPPES